MKFSRDAYLDDDFILSVMRLLTDVIDDSLHILLDDVRESYDVSRTCICINTKH